MVDRDGLLDHLRELELALSDWERYKASITLPELRTNRDTRNMVLHALLVSIQASIDIANHIIAESPTRHPATYRESFEILVEQGNISPELGRNLSDLAGFRNVLVHIYWSLDIEKVYGVLQNEVGVLREFQTAVKGLLT